MFALSFILMVCTLFFSEASYVDTLKKCSLKDEQCVKDSVQKVIRDIGDTGIDELNLHPIDPMHIENVSFTLLDALTLTVKEGELKGFKNCAFTKFRLDVDKRMVTEHFYCDVLYFKGQFVIKGPALQSVLGSTSSSGNGKAKMKLEKASIHIDFPVSVIRKEDGDIYLKVSKKAKYDYDLQKATFDIKNLVIGNTDISEFATTYLNSNWQTVTKTFGKTFVDEGLQYLMSFAQKFYDAVPTKHFVEEDLTSYLED